jgi:hypothetical protein
MSADDINNNSNRVRYKCSHCKRELPPDGPHPCPFCGKTGRDIIAVNTDTLKITEVQPTAILERVYRRYPALLVSIAITVIVPIITLLLHLDEQIAMWPRLPA